MNAKTELLLLHMLWASGKALRPTFRKLNESFEAWAYRNGLLQQIHRLEARGLLESREVDFDETRFHRLTEAGRIAALGGRDPEAAWATDWDRKWRLFLFDVPESKKSLRRKLTRALSALGCGCLQGSVWISPTRPAGIDDAFPEQGADCSHLMILEAESRGPKVDRKMAESAWDFERINVLYQQHLDAMDRFPDDQVTENPQVLAAWAAIENKAWLTAVKSDPMLPKPLLSKSYLGRQAWRKRRTVLRRAGILAGRLMKAPSKR
jgi:phenylacetic acid degradation operon negative regulatory protein